jgi:hypothetical protein
MEDPKPSGPPAPPRAPPVILFRPSLAEKGELDVARRHFKVITSRAEVQLFVAPGKWGSAIELVETDIPLVIPRYSALPYYHELETDIERLGGRLINTLQQHLFAADLQNWYAVLRDLTPRTWFRAEEVPFDHTGPFVLKGATNSRKHKWSTHMFAKDRDAVGTVLLHLLDDPLIAPQGIYVREFEPFVDFGLGLHGLPITQEYRFFCLDEDILAAGFYWSEHADLLLDEGQAAVVRGVPLDFVKREVLPRLKGRIRFVVVDVAKHIDGRWRVVELNDASMSGLGCVDPEVLYSRLREAL